MSEISQEAKKKSNENIVPEICLENTFVHENNLRLSAWNIPLTEKSRTILIQKINDLFDKHLKH